MLQPQIVEKPELCVIGLEAAFISALSPQASNAEVIGPLWQKFFERAQGVPHRIGQEMYGVIYSRPDSQRAHPHELQYIAGVAVSNAVEPPAGMVARSVPAGTFAVFTHRGPIKGIVHTLHEVYRVWLMQSAYEHAGIADVELYDRRFRPGSEDSEMEYWISVRPRDSAE
jgi:AraC family transcriptional regulator